MGSGLEQQLLFGLLGVVLTGLGAALNHYVPKWLATSRRWYGDRAILLRDHDSTARDLIAVTKERDELRAALTAAASHSSLNQDELADLRRRLKALEDGKDEMDARFDEQQLAFIDSVRYIADLTVYILDHGDPKTIPKPPKSISDEVHDEILARVAARQQGEEKG